MNWMRSLQQLGRSLMLPTITLPIAAVLLRLADLPWGYLHAESVGITLQIAGESIFSFLPLIFAVGVTLGLTGNSSISAMSALFSYYMFMLVTQNSLGSGFQLGISGGILIGILTAITFHKCKNVKLPEYIQFFGGSRMVPLFTGMGTLILSYVMIYLGPILVQGMHKLTGFLLDLGGFGTFLYGIAHRLLVPSGLHHILNNFFWFQLGGYEQSNGTIVYGDLPRFFAGDPSAGIYMAGLYPVMMFALPTIAFAIIQEAREDLKPNIQKTFMVAALASLLTGVTEPIEFAFLFVAPYLFVIHAVLSGTVMWLAYALDIHHGFSFSAGAIDFLINLHLSHNGWMLIPIGLCYGLLYYILFRQVIRRYQIPTPGREEGSSLEEWAGDIPSRAPLILQALGGKENIKQLEACITRLRLTLKNDRLMDIAALRHLGAAGVIRLGGGNVQVVFGTYSELIREEIMKTLKRDIHLVTFCAPVQGRMIPLEEVPDQTFSSKLVGNGAAFLPERGELVSPVEGQVMHIYPSMHALGILTKEGLEVLLHIGIDTSHLSEHLFTACVEAGDQVVPGQLLIKFNYNKVKKMSKSLATPMVITNSKKVRSFSYAPFKSVKKGQASVMSVILKPNESAEESSND